MAAISKREKKNKKNDVCAPAALFFRESVFEPSIYLIFLAPSRLNYLAKQNGTVTNRHPDMAGILMVNFYWALKGLVIIKI